MKRLAGVLCLMSSTALAQVCPQSGCNSTVTPAPGATFLTNGVQTCTPATGTIGALGQGVTLSCPGASSYNVIVTPNASAPLIGTLSSSDPLSGAGRLIFKAGVGELDVNTVPMLGSTGTVEYRMTGSADPGGLSLAASAYTSGSATVTIYASYNPEILFLGAPVHLADEAAVRAGRAYSTSTSLQALGNATYENLVLANPAGNNVRAIITLRETSCDIATGVVATHWYSVSNPTTNLPTTAAAITNRRTGGTTSTLSATYNAGVATFPDTSPSTPLASRIAGPVPTGGIVGGPGTTMRTLEPGNSTVLTIVGQATGIGGATPNCAITVAWYEEALN